MHNSLTLDQSDFYRSLLSEILPYEVPLRFSLDHIHRRLKTNEVTTLDGAVLGDEGKAKETISYSFALQRGRKSPRQLFVMHPSSFKRVASLYEKYAWQIVSNCDKSSWTLRAPAGVARKAVPKRRGRNSSKESSGEELEGIKASPSYFLYRSYTLLSEFYDSAEFSDLESRFTQLRQLDVSSCFANIYTHSISWAIRGKANAKKAEARSSDRSFDAEFDRLMTNANHGETHGVLVGPEASRVFAELILQEVDSAAASLLKGRVVEGRDCEIRRYVDDFMIFFNDASVADEVEEAIRETLQYYKLHINETKVVDVSSPFFSRVNGVKQSISEFIEGVIRKYSRLSHKQVRRRRSLDRVLVSGFKKIVAHAGCTYDQCVSYAIVVMANQVLERSVAVRSVLVEANIVAAAARFLELDFRYQVAVHVSRFFAQLEKGCETTNANVASPKSAIEESIGTECLTLVANALQRQSPPLLELTIFLIAVADNEVVHKTSSSVPARLWDLLSHSSMSREVDYFAVLSLMYFCGDRSQYDELRNEIVEKVLQWMQSENGGGAMADRIMLASDLACCPYLEDSVRGEFLKVIKGWTGVTDSWKRLLEQMDGKFMFFDWGVKATLSYILEKQPMRCYD